MRLQSGISVNQPDAKANFRMLDIIVKQLSLILNGNLDIENLRGQVVTAERSGGTAATEIAVPHTLGRIPLYYITLRSNGGAVVSDGATAWTTSEIYINISAEEKVTLFIM